MSICELKSSNGIVDDLPGILSELKKYFSSLYSESTIRCYVNEYLANVELPKLEKHQAKICDKDIAEEEFKTSLNTILIINLLVSMVFLMSFTKYFWVN